MSAKNKGNILMVDDEAGKLLIYEVMLGDRGENLIKANSSRVGAVEYHDFMAVGAPVVPRRLRAVCDACKIMITSSSCC